jgi:hypothetical protein
MKTLLIEQFDQSRYNLVKWLTVGWATWFGAYIIKDLMDDNSIILQFFTGFAGLIGFVVFVIYLQKYFRLASKVKYSRLNDALNNELNLIYKYKSVYLGFFVLLGTIGLFFCISPFYQIPAKTVCEVTLYLGILSALTAWLIYNRE